MKKLFILLLSIIIFLGLDLSFSFAQTGQTTLTITPPLIKINMDPGETWSSSVKIVNNNPETLTVYSQTMDFKSGEEGGIEFILAPESKEGEKISLSQWIEIASEPQILSAFQSREIPFTIKVPESAEPGGHYAAILIGTKPIKEEAEGTAIRISSMISSLILLNVQGEIIESGWIREFSTEKEFYQKPEVELKVSFENKGNVHLHPVGGIEIYNMWGKKRGTIPINQKSHFGNVLAQSKRVWNFKWKGEDSPFEVGRYKAELTLGFGEESHQTISSILYFWVIPLMPILGILGGLLLFLAAVVLGIKAYIKKAIIIAQMDAGLMPSLGQKTLESRASPQIELTSQVLKGPIDEAIVDLREINRPHRQITGRFNFLLKKYYKAIFFLLIIILWGAGVFFYLQDTLKSEKSFEIIQREQGRETLISSEQIFKEEISSKQGVEKDVSSETEGIPSSLSLKILNGSGIPRIVARTAILLENEGFKVGKIGNADSFNYEETIIEYKKGRKKEAEILNQLLHGIAELREVEYQIEDIVIIIGRDYSASIEQNDAE